MDNLSNALEMTAQEEEEEEAARMKAADTVLYSLQSYNILIITLPIAAEEVLLCFHFSFH